MTIYAPEQTTGIGDTGVTSQPEVKSRNRVRTQSIVMLVIGLVFTLFTYQYFHHGLWGKLNNYNKLPLIKLQGTTVKNNNLMLSLYRPNGPDTYGSFVEKVTIAVPGSSAPVEVWTPTMLAKVSPTDIQNVYKFQHVHTGPWGLVIPLASKATVRLPLSASTAAAIQKAGQAKVTVQDVSGTSWTYSTALN